MSATTQRPIHERWEVEAPNEQGHSVVVRLDGQEIGELDRHRADAFRSLIAAAARKAAVLVDLPDVAGGGQIATHYWPSGVVEADWRQKASDTWTPVELLADGAVCVAP